MDRRERSIQTCSPRSSRHVASNRDSTEGRGGAGKEKTEVRNIGAMLLVTLLGCTSLAPQAEKIRVTSTGADVEQCKVLSAIESRPPYIGPNDGVNQLRNNAAALGADTLLLTSSGALRSETGMAH